MPEDTESSGGVYHFVDEKTDVRLWVISDSGREAITQALFNVLTTLVPGIKVGVESAPPAPPASALSPLVNRATFINPDLLNKPISGLKLSRGAAEFARVNLEADIIGRLVAWTEREIIARGKLHGKRKTDVARWLVEIKNKLLLRGVTLGKKLNGWEPTTG
ncbi:MAG: hypothetical protein EXS55_00895 [Candidatus Magasanikbacteria bacterium]|nr:hypothetical protein [Candidatus Magasanikbacteria bacterium]